ncbi:MAG: hypothetical protein U1G08_12690 [Verrucomicrobiota bacterium]
MIRWTGSILLGAAVILSPATHLAWGGPLQREANTTLRLPEVPGSRGYRLTPAFPGESFHTLAIISFPGETNRLVFANQGGDITLIPDLSSPRQEMFLNLIPVTVSGGEQGLLGLAFHPSTLKTDSSLFSGR